MMDEEVLSQGTESVQETNEIDTTQQTDDVSREGQDVSVGESLSSWDQDKRYNEMWKGDPNNLYKSYVNMEKMFPTVQSELKTYKERIAESEKRHQEYEGRISELSQFKSVFDTIEGNPLYKEKVLAAIQQAKEEETRMKFGDLPPEAIAKLEKAERVEQQLNEWQQEKALGEARIAVDATLTDLNGIAEKYGFEFDQREFLTYCKENSIPPQYLKMAFMEKAADIIAESSSKRAQTSVTKQADLNKQRAISSAPTRAKTNQPMSSYERLMAAYNKS